MKRRTFIRLLVGLGIGVPVAIESATFLGLLSDTFLGGGGGDDTETPTTIDGVAQGDTFLPDTEAVEHLSTVSLTSGEPWTLTLTVSVENEGEDDYVLRLGSVTIDEGETVRGNANTGPIPPGESGTVTEQWEIPPGSMPRTLSVIATVGTGENATVVRRDVRLARMSVSG